MPYERKEITPEQIREQEEICRRIFDRVTADGRRPLAMVDTYGCQQNEADSEKLRGYLEAMGFAFTQDENEADLVIFNTCAVREHAEQRVLGNVGALNHTKAKNPDQIIAVCGCMAQQAHMAEKLKKSYRIVPTASWISSSARTSSGASRSCWRPSCASTSACLK